MIYERKISDGDMTQRQVKCLLKSLVAKAGLSFDEIVDAHARRRSRGSNTLLDVQKDGPQLRFACGQNPHFIAVLTHEDQASLD